MALIKCPECGKQISESASACPNCGAPVTQETIQRGKELMQEQIRKENSFTHVDLGGLAMIFSVFIPIVGFILGIVAIVKGMVRRGVYALILSGIFGLLYYMFMINVVFKGRL